jgi:hypothetical protein
MKSFIVGILVVLSTGSVASSALGQSEVALSYFQQGTQVFEWQFPLKFSTDTLVALGERITLPGTKGFVDSVQIRIDSLSGDSLEVDLDSVQVYTAANGQNISYIDYNTVYDFEYIYPNQVHRGSFVTVKFPHVAVPKNFFVTVAPNVSSVGSHIVFTNSFIIAGDSEATRLVTSDNERSGVVILAPGLTLVSDYFDSLVKPAGDPLPVFSNFYITAFVDTATTAGAVTQSPTAEVALQSYPNPFTANTTITLGSALASDHASLVVYDRLGRAVQDLSQAIRNRTSAQFNGTNLPAGFYFARYSDGTRELTLPMALQK